MLCKLDASKYARSFEQNPTLPYRVIPGHRNWQIETAVWNLAGFLHCALKTRWQRFGHFLDDFLNDFLDDSLCEILNFLYEILNFLYQNLNFFYEFL